MKILQVIPFFSPKFGGSVTVLYELSRELARRNHDVTIITSDFGFDPQYADTIRVAGVTVIPFHCVANVGLFLYSPSMKIWLEKNLKDYDIIHLHTYRSYQNAVAHMIALKYTIRYIVQAHGSVLPFFERQILKKLYDFVWGHNILSDAGKLIAVSKEEKDQYLKMGMPQNKIEIIPNAIDISDYLDLPEKGTFRKKYGIGSNEKIILYLGRIHRIKGIDLLIKAYSKLLKKEKNIKLVIIGPDEGYLNSLEQLISSLKIHNTIIFTGPLYNKDKYAAFIDADFFVMPSYYEIFGNSLIEALYFEIPSIVTTGCSIAELLREVVYVIEPNDDAIVTALSTLINDDQRADIMRKKGRKIVQEKFEISKIAQKFEEIYEAI